MSNIEWTEKTWNPIVGCTVVSPGCTNCYAMKMAGRLEAIGGAPHYNGTTQKTRGGAVWTGKMALSEKALIEPLKRKKPTTYFVNSMGDLFHEGASDEWIDQVFAVMALCPQHTFQVLTKRSKRMREYMSNRNPNGHHPGMDYAALMAATGAWDTPALDLRTWPLPNVWLGVSAENQEYANNRIPDLLATPAAKRFVSAEPLLGSISLNFLRVGPRGSGRVVGDTYDALSGEAVDSTDRGYVRRPDGNKLDWVIVGGESGPGARPMHPDWARRIRDKCGEAGTAFFMKQMSGVRKSSMPQIPDDLLIRETPQ